MGFAKGLEGEVDFFSLNLIAHLKGNFMCFSSNWMTPEVETRRMTSAPQLIIHKV